MNRKSFLKSAALAALATPIFTGRSQPAPGTPGPRKRPHLKKALMYNTFRGPTADKLSLTDKFKLVRAAGFDGIEVRGALNQKEVVAARDASGLAIPSVTGSVHWIRTLS